MIALASLAVGALLGWLVMRGRQANPEVQIELIRAKAHIHSFEENARLAAANHEALNLQATQWQEALGLAQGRQAPPAERAPQVTRLPALEEEIIALQTLAKTVQQEFQLFAELQRTFTLTSTTIQAFSDSPVPQKNVLMANLAN